MHDSDSSLSGPGFGESGRPIQRRKSVAGLDSGMYSRTPSLAVSTSNIGRRTTFTGVSVSASAMDVDGEGGDVDTPVSMDISLPSTSPVTVTPRMRSRSAGFGLGGEGSQHDGMQVDSNSTVSPVTSGSASQVQTSPVRAPVTPTTPQKSSSSKPSSPQKTSPGGSVINPSVSKWSPDKPALSDDNFRRRFSAEITSPSRASSQSQSNVSPTRVSPTRAPGTSTSISSQAQTREVVFPPDQETQDRCRSLLLSVVTRDAKLCQLSNQVNTFHSCSVFESLTIIEKELAETTQYLTELIKAQGINPPAMPQQNSSNSSFLPTAATLMTGRTVPVPPTVEQRDSR